MDKVHSSYSSCAIHLKSLVCPNVDKARLGKAQSAFSQLRSIWRSKQYSLKTKKLLCNSNVKSVLLYGSESWRVVKTDTMRLEVFHNNVSGEDARSFGRLKWLRHLLKMEQDRITKVALRWTPPGKRKPGRPKTTWRRTVTHELEQMKLSWGQAQHAAKIRANHDVIKFGTHDKNFIIYDKTYRKGTATYKIQHYGFNC